MRVLIAIAEQTFTNPYISTLAAGLRSCGVDLTCSGSEFWSNPDAYDIIHIQWPDQLFKEGRTSLDEFEARLDEIKSRGKKLIATCHNLQAHYTTQNVLNNVYGAVYSRANIIVHLGPYSQQCCRELFPNAQNVLIPHHVYDSMYPGPLPSAKEAKLALGLDPEGKYILCMGNFRDSAEREIAHVVSRALKPSGIRVIAPMLYKLYPSHNPLYLLTSRTQYLYDRIRYRAIICNESFVSDEELPLYYAASQMALIQRTHILNSGNVPMAFLMGKVCVGPDVGNVGPLLKEFGNPAFNPADKNSIVSAVREGLRLSENGVGEENRSRALQNLSVDAVARCYARLYSDAYSSENTL